MLLSVVVSVCVCLSVCLWISVGLPVGEYLGVRALLCVCVCVCVFLRACLASADPPAKYLCVLHLESKLHVKGSNIADKPY